MTSEEDVNFVWNKDIQFAPLRPFSEFLTDKSRFELPAFNDIGKWNNRIVSNLLYFQSNYFIFMLIACLLISALDPKGFAIGFIIILLIGILVLVALSDDNNIVTVRSEHPYALLAVILVISYLAISYISYVIIAIFAFAFPLLFVLVHASLRLRGFMNKINRNFKEGIVQKTVMATILKALGIEIKV
uniref:PRA1 family protein n=1 Tax=Panagrolaimus sp. JU765 TaxID=591449 RepID=A0AC34QBB0_9BILA